MDASAGIVLLQSALDLEKYCLFLNQKVPFIPPRSFANGSGPIEMPTACGQEFLFEPYIETDSITIRHNQLHYCPKEGWLELNRRRSGASRELSRLESQHHDCRRGCLKPGRKIPGGTGIESHSSSRRDPFPCGNSKDQVISGKSCQDHRDPIHAGWISSSTGSQRN